MLLRLITAALRGLRSSATPGNTSHPQAAPSPAESNQAAAARENDTGITHAQSGDVRSAHAAFTRAIELDPGLLAARINLANLLFSTRADLRGAAAHCEAALRIAPGHLEALRLLSLARYEFGEVDVALATLKSTDAAREDSLCLEYRAFMTHAVPGHDLSRHFDLHRAWSAAFHRDAGIAPAARPASRIKKRAPITVGYVSSDFREHAVASFLLPAITHDGQAINAICYSNHAQPDELTQRFQAGNAKWRDIATLDDTAAASLVREDGVDILVDCSGHTRGNRLGLFARRAAPVQATWLGYFNTTGLESMDWRITDAQFDPPGASEAFHTEKLLRLAPAAWCYRPAANAPALGPAPSDARGHITFGSFNHVAKLNNTVLETWAQVLRAVPGSTLRIAAIPGDETLRRIAGVLGRHGVAPDRIQPLARLSKVDFLAEITRTDIALDAFPYTGGATTCDCLWMGVPVVTLAGAFGFSRSAAAALLPAGLEQLVAHTPEDYVRIATELARSGTGTLRSTLRERMAASPLMDEKGFVRALHAAYEHMLD